MKGAVEHKAMHNLRVAHGDATIFRQWRQNFTTSLGHVKGGHEQVVHKEVRR